MSEPTPTPAPPADALRNAWQVTKTVILRLRFIFMFIIVGLIVGNWTFITNVADRVTRPSKSDSGVQGELEWYCPMHPSVVRADETQKCPICGMGLSKRKRGEKVRLPAGILSQIQLTPHRIRQAGIGTVEVGYRTLVREIRTVGTIDWDERRLAHISARVAGRADELYVNFVGVKVKQGDPVYRLYSPDLVTTQEEYLLALKALDELKAQASPSEDALLRAKRLADSARERLRLWGITEAQVAELEKTRKAQTYLVIYSPISGTVIEKDIHAGHYVTVGEDPYTIVDDSVVWVNAEIFERDIALVKEGQEVEITAEAYPGEKFAGTVSFIQPTLEKDTRTVKVRIDAENREAKLKPGMYVTAALRLPLGRRGEVFYGC
jgi:Cu(I)/Ag(I) efflux system membrane fusion protein